jgi:hypothetical protein
MDVYLLFHEEQGERIVRGVYADESDALAACTTRTPSGATSRAYDAHTKWCCTVEAMEVHQATIEKSEPLATSPSMSAESPHTSASMRSGDDSPGSPV